MQYNTQIINQTICILYVTNQHNSNTATERKLTKYTHQNHSNNCTEHLRLYKALATLSLNPCAPSA